MTHYIYSCFNCKAEYSASYIEDNLIYLCPKCGKAEKNKPLEGVLEIEYDYDLIKSEIIREEFLKRNIGDLSKYLNLWPLKSERGKCSATSYSQLELLRLSPQIFNIKSGNNSIKIFDDSRNPTLSYKDRASILVAIKALQLGIDEISAASTGNAGSSLAGICARLGIKSHIFVPKNIPESKRIQIQAFGSEIYVVDGDYDEAFDLCLEFSQKKKWYNRNTAYNPLTIEGKKSSVYDMFILLQGHLPENIFVSVGDGVIISGIFKGLKELFKLGWIDKYPKLIAVQAEGSDALARYVKSNKFEYLPATTLADSISAGAPRNLYMAAEAIKETNGEVIVVSDNEILEAQKSLSTDYGILSEPAASASFAGFNKVSYQNSILMLTGNGLKDTNSLKTWNSEPEIRSYNDWKEKYLDD